MEVVAVFMLGALTSNYFDFEEQFLLIRSARTSTSKRSVLHKAFTSKIL